MIGADLDRKELKPLHLEYEDDFIDCNLFINKFTSSDTG